MIQVLIIILCRTHCVLLLIYKVDMHYIVCSWDYINVCITRVGRIYSETPLIRIPEDQLNLFELEDFRFKGEIKLILNHLEISNEFEINGNFTYQGFKIEGFHCTIKLIQLSNKCWPGNLRRK